MLIIAPCGYSKEQSRDEYRSLTFSAEWAKYSGGSERPRVRNGCQELYSRPGPRLVTGMEAMVKTIHPYVRVRPGAEAALMPVSTRNAQTASA